MSRAGMPMWCSPFWPMYFAEMRDFAGMVPSLAVLALDDPDAQGVGAGLKARHHRVVADAGSRLGQAHTVDAAVQVPGHRIHGARAVLDQAAGQFGDEVRELRLGRLLGALDGVPEPGDQIEVEIDH